MTRRSPWVQRLQSVASAVLVLVSLVGCARVNDMGKRLVASSMNAVAVVNETLLEGEVTLLMDRTGRVNLAATSPSSLTCRGEMFYTATRSGVIHLRCSDGTDTRLEFGALSDISGYASGRTAHGPVTLAFGMEASAAGAYLTLPAGQRMVRREAHVYLEPINSPGVTP
jgi:hypothetical protein